MVQRSQDWEWSSLKPTVRSGPEGLLSDGPMEKPAQWTRHVNGVPTDAELESLRHSLARDTFASDTEPDLVDDEEEGVGDDEDAMDE